MDWQVLKSGQKAPSGWDYNPSSPRRRAPVIGLAVIGLAIASYLTLYQMGLINNVWEPFFGHGSQVILNSSVARLLPVPDASLGCLGYLIDVLLGSLGGRQRWRAAPWLVLLFGINVGVLAAGSLLLVILQSAVFHAWCTLCLVSALVSISIAGLAQDEVRATWQYLKSNHPV